MGLWSQSFPGTPKYTEENIPGQYGKVFLITGANAGVGCQVASILYSKNAKVYIAARSEAKAQAAISSIKEQHPTSNGKLIFIQIDLSDLTTIKKAAETFLAQETQLHWLCNNAGVMAPPEGSKSAQGYELQYATNVLGPFLFTKLLLPILQKTARTAPKGSVRVSWAGSMGIELSPKGGIEFEADGITPKESAGSVACYQGSKVANWWLAYEFARRSGNADGVLHNAFNPGALKSDLYRHGRNGTFGTRMAVKMMDALWLYPPVYGAYTELYCGFSDDITLDKHQAAYIVPWGKIDTENVRKDVAAGRGEKSASIWTWCERETRKYA